MQNIFFISDLHLGHKKVVQFNNDDGQKMRPWNNLNDMHNAMIAAWNSAVTDADKVYVIGDFAFDKKSLAIGKELKGRKILVKGNHDVLKLKDYMEVFSDIRGCHVLEDYVLTHVPIHESCIDRFKINIHGHLHSRRIIKNGLIDYRYQNCSVEQINYTPIEFSALKEKIKSENKKYEEQICLLDLKKVEI